MTDNEIIKALECCGSLGEYHCDEKCPRLNNGIEKTSYCRRDLIISAYDLIKRQQAEKEALIAGHETLQEALAEKNAKIERLTKRAEQYPCVVNVGNNCFVYAKSLDDYDNFIGDVSAEGIKEFAERLKERFKNINSEPADEQFDWILHDYAPRKIDEVAKELTEAKDDE